MEEGEREQLGKCFSLDIPIVSKNKLGLSSRPQRQRNLPRSETYGAEWREPGSLSLAIRLQGVLPMQCPACHGSSRQAGIG
jgi:hypothetical protein